MSQALAFPRSRIASFILTNRLVVTGISILILLPSIFFAAALRPLPAFMIAAGSLGALALVARRPNRKPGVGGMLDEPLDLRSLALFVALAGVLFILGGAMHLLYPPMDWRIRDAVLADLSRDAFPISYHVDGTDYVLRAPLGMYLVPAAVGRAFGLYASHVALWMQNSYILGSIFYLLAKLGRGWPHIAIMILYSCVVVLGVLLFYDIGSLMHFATLQPKLERIAVFGLDSWHPLWQYSGSAVQFFWAPNHALPGWWLATLLILCADAQTDEAATATAAAGSMLWSPLAIIPAVLWLLYSGARRFRSHLASVRSWFAVVFCACFVPIATFLVSGSGSIDHGFAEFGVVFIGLYLLFLCAQLNQASFVYEHRSLVSEPLYRLFVFCVALLVALPLFKFGPYNDLVMRGSITALVIVAFLFGGIVLQPQRIGRRSFLVGCALVAGGAPSFLFEASRALFYRPFAISDCSLMEANHALGEEAVPSNYVVESAQLPAWLLKAPSQGAKLARDRRCWSDEARGK